MLLPHESFSVICALSVGLGIYCEKQFNIQATISLLITSLIIVASLGLSAYYLPDLFFIDIIDNIRAIPFADVFLSYMLGILLYAGSVHVDTKFVKSAGLEIVSLAIVATLGSILLIAIAMHSVSIVLGIHLNWIDCLVFGSIISPTDPIAVLGLLKQLKAPQKLSTIIAGESLFNDGVGIVAFSVLTSAKMEVIDLSILSIISTFMKMAIGGILLGILAYFSLKVLFRSIDLSITQKILCTITYTISGYEICEVLGVSGALYVVILGLSTSHLISNFKDKEQILLFWAVIDEFLNSILFIMIGTLAIGLHFTGTLGYLAVSSILIVLIARFICVNLNLSIVHLYKPQPKYLGSLITWSGLRGGLAIALALCVPQTDIEAYRTILLLTYANVIFSVIIQGITSENLLKWYLKIHQPVKSNAGFNQEGVN